MALDQLPSVLTTPFWVQILNATTHVKIWELFLLSWSLQTRAVLRKAYSTLAFLRRTFSSQHTPSDIKRRLYLSLILPILTYCSPVW